MAAHDDKPEARAEKRLKALNKAREVRIDSFIKKMLDDPEGRDFVWWLLQLGRIGDQPFTSNALTTAFNCGELNVGNQILARLTAVDSASYARMMQEKQNEYEAYVASEDDPGRNGGRAGYYDTGADAGPDSISG